MRSLILITNDDSVSAKGLQVLVDAVREYGDIVVMSTELNASGKSHALTTNQPLRVRKVRANLLHCVNRSAWMIVSSYQ